MRPRAHDRRAEPAQLFGKRIDVRSGGAPAGEGDADDRQARVAAAAETLYFDLRRWEFVLGADRQWRGQGIPGEGKNISNVEDAMGFGISVWARRLGKKWGNRRERVVREATRAVVEGLGTGKGDAHRFVPHIVSCPN